MIGEGEGSWQDWALPHEQFCQVFPGPGCYVLFSLLATPHSLWEFSSPTRDWTGPSAVRGHTSNHWASREFPVMFILYELLHEAKFSLLERVQFTLGTRPSPYSGRPSRPALCQSGALILTRALLYKAFPQAPKLLFSSTSLLIHLFLTVRPWLAEIRKRASCSDSC